MPKLTKDTNHTCYLCGCQAFFVSYNSKKFRCVEKITQCPGFIRKAEESRQKNIPAERRRAHMKQMSTKGNAKLKDLHSDSSWLEEKRKKISNAVKERGGHQSHNNPMYGKCHTMATKQKLSEIAIKRNPNCYLKASKTKVSRGISIPLEAQTEWEIYRKKVSNYTYKSWKYHYDTINPLRLERGKDYELDHKFSITEGFKQNIDPKLIGHYCNLILLPKFENRSKRINCSITLEELIKNYECSIIPSDSPSSDTTTS